ncbi:hypothetical protein BURK1_02778 [Burkholderiales bacterium]|nr:hypothetical protein BURK1_02778 [Burkholderiales bacterium]
MAAALAGARAIPDSRPGPGTPGPMPLRTG